MISEMAMEDVEVIRERCGRDLDPRDIIRLNAVGCAVERHAHSGELHALPRLAYLGDVVFHEPTIGDELWLSSLAKVYDFTNAETRLILRTVALTSKVLPDPTDLRAVRRAVNKTRRLIAPWTIRQVASAVVYAMHGDDANACEEAAEKPSDKKKKWWWFRRRESENLSFEVGALRVGQALNLGTVDELKKLTLSEIHVLITYKSELGNGKGARKSEHDRRVVDYFVTRDEIAAKYGAMKEVANGNQ